ncbi:MAG: chemotaxis protein CheC [Sulfuricurvum sp.]|nr:chemotaxis protein CheC [Sulfuricurvum sp.]
MLKRVEFSGDHLDVLRELMNIAVGNATASIADLLQAFGTMHIPKIAISDIKGLKQYMHETIPSESSHYVTKQLFGGPLGGEFIFVITDEVAINLGNHLYDVEAPNDADIYDAVIELTNILSATMISRLTEELNIKVQFFLPSTEIISGNDLIYLEETAEYSQIIIISTQMEFQNQNINGHIFILAKDAMIQSLKDLIDQKLEELYA